MTRLNRLSTLFVQQIRNGHFSGNSLAAAGITIATWQLYLGIVAPFLYDAQDVLLLGSNMILH